MKPWHNHIFPRLAQASFLTLTLEPQRVKLYGKVKWDQCRVTNGTVLTLSTPLKHIYIYILLSNNGVKITEQNEWCCTFIFFYSLYGVKITPRK